MLWDGGSTLSFVTFKLARKLQLHGKPVKLEIITVGGKIEQIDSFESTEGNCDSTETAVGIWDGIGRYTSGRQCKRLLVLNHYIQ